MNPIKHIDYQTPDQFEAIIKQREADAAQLPTGTARQSVLLEVTFLRSYAQLQRRPVETSEVQPG